MFANSAEVPELQVIVGLPFAGKTTLAKQVARQARWQRVDVDDINTSSGIGLNGANITPEAWSASFEASYQETERLLRTGWSVVYDGHALRRADRDRLRAIASAVDARFRLRYVATPERVARFRMTQNRIASDRNDIRDDFFELALRLFEPPSSDEEAEVIEPR